MVLKRGAKRKKGTDSLEGSVLIEQGETCFKLKEGRSILGIRKMCFMIRIARHRLSGEMMETPFLETCKVRLDGALST